MALPRLDFSASSERIQYRALFSFSWLLICLGLWPPHPSSNCTTPTFGPVFSSHFLLWQFYKDPCDYTGLTWILFSSNDPWSIPSAKSLVLRYTCEQDRTCCHWNIPHAELWKGYTRMCWHRGKCYLELYALGTWMADIFSPFVFILL